MLWQAVGIRVNDMPNRVRRVYRCNRPMFTLLWSIQHCCCCTFEYHNATWLQWPLLQAPFLGIWSRIVVHLTACELCFSQAMSWRAYISSCFVFVRCHKGQHFFFVSIYFFFVCTEGNFLKQTKHWKQFEFKCSRQISHRK